MSDHPNFSKLKKIQVGQLKPSVKEGYLHKKGADFHTWKKRWFIMKDQYIWYFAKNTGSAQPKGVIELDQNSSATLVLDQKKPTIMVKSVYRTQEMNSDDSVEEAKSWVDAINSHVKTLGKPSTATVTPAAAPPQPNQTTQAAPAPTETPAGPLPWKQVQERISSEEGQWDSTKIKDFMVTLGKVTCDQYLYSIMQKVLSSWEDADIAAFWWEDFCDGDLEDLETVVAGVQGDSTVAVNASGEPLQANETVFVLGRDEKGAIRLANIYHWVTKREEFNWSEVTRCILSAIANWGLHTDEVFFEVFVNEIVKSWSASEIAAFVSYVATWENWPPHVVTFFKKFVKEFIYFYTMILIDLDYQRIGMLKRKKSFINIVTVMWDWSKESIQRLHNVLHEGE
ncbi:Pleckstrin [Entamoeba marina]